MSASGGKRLKPGLFFFGFLFLLCWNSLLAAPAILSIDVTPDPLIAGDMFTVTVQAQDMSRGAVFVDVRRAVGRRLRLPLVINGGTGMAGGRVPVDATIARPVLVDFTVVIEDMNRQRVRQTRTITLNPLPPRVTIESPANLSVFQDPAITLTGLTSKSVSTVSVNGVNAVLNGRQWSVDLNLVEGRNVLTAVVRNSIGQFGTDSIQVTLDSTPPIVTITTPEEGFVTSFDHILVAGMINDIVVGTVNAEQATVVVNGIEAQVINRCFLVPRIALQPGANTLTAVATDRAGNRATHTITVTREEIVPRSEIRVVSGNAQTGVANSVVMLPLVVEVLDENKVPIQGKDLIFKVTSNNGMLRSGDKDVAALALKSDAQGRAQVFWRLGSRTGAGNNLVEVTAVGVDGKAVFSAVSTPMPAQKINIDRGDNQVGVIAQPLPEPFVVVVTDEGHNRLAGVEVTFSVVKGGGSFNGQSTLTGSTDGDGRFSATLMLGPDEGSNNNLVEATFQGNAGASARFSASGQRAGDPAETEVSGVVLDNTGQPIEGVTISLDGTGLSQKTGANGQFSLKPAPVGKLHLIANGATAVRPGVWPELRFELVTVPGQNNTLGMPIKLLPLDIPNGLFVSPTEGGTLTLPRLPGFAVKIAPGSVTFPDGSKSGLVTATLVNTESVPMTPTGGQNPNFFVTIQPVGALFDPPAPLTIPNVENLVPREITEMFSFDHDLGQFVTIGTGTVTDDGLLIVSNPGVGILKAGWHCGGNPQQVGQGERVEVRVNKEGVMLAKDETVDVVATGMPLPKGTPAYSWTSANPTIATVDFAPGNNSQTHPNTGRIKLLKQGKTTIKVAYQCKSGAIATTEVKINSFRVDLAFEGLAEENATGTNKPHETDPGGFVTLNDNDNDNLDGIDKNETRLPLPKDDPELVPLNLAIIPKPDKGKLTLTVPPELRVWKDRKKHTTPRMWSLKTETPPSVVYVEGASLGMGELKLTWDGASPPLVDTVKVTVVDVEFIETKEDRGTDLLPLFNPTPTLVLDKPANPGSGKNPSMTVKGTVTSYLAPIDANHIFINGSKASSVTFVDSGPMGLGPFKNTFVSRAIPVGNDDFDIVATAVNAVNAVGYDALSLRVDRNKNSGAISGRTITEKASVPPLPANLASFLDGFRFKIEVKDPIAFATQNEVEVTFNTGVETKQVKLTKNAASNSFRSKDLLLAPENLQLNKDDTLAVKNSRFKGKFGKTPKAIYKPGKGIQCEDPGIATGVLFVRGTKPIDFVQSGVERDVTARSADITFTIEAGGPGKTVGKTTASTVRSLKQTGANLPAPMPAAIFGPVQITGNDVKLTRVSDDPNSPAFNLYRSPSARPLMGVRTPLPRDASGSAQPNATLTELHVNFRGFARVEVPAIMSAMNVEPVSGLQVFKANPPSPLSEDLNPPMAATDFVDLLNCHPVVLITSETGGNTLNRRLRGEVVSFVNPLAVARVQVNGVNVTKLTLDANSPATGPWRYTFQHAVTIPNNMDRFSVLVTAYDGMESIGQDGVDYEIARNISNNITSVTVRNRNTLPPGPDVNGLIDGDTVTLVEALAFLRNRQFRIEGNPVLRGTLGFMQDAQRFRIQRQTDAAGATTGMPVNIILAGGAYRTGRYVLLAPPPQPSTGFKPNPAFQLVANLGEFLRAEAQGNHMGTIRKEIVSPTGPLLYSNGAAGGLVPALAVIPGKQADFAATPAEILLRARVGASGFNPATHAGRMTIMGEVRSRAETGANLAQPNAVQNATTSQWVNFAPVARNITLTRANNDPRDPRFYLYRLLRTGTNTEQPFLPVNQGTFPGNAQQTPVQVNASNANAEVVHVRSNGVLTFTSSALANRHADEAVLGPRLQRIVTTLTQIQTGNVTGIVDQNGETDRDFAPQISERIVTTVNLMAAPRFKTALSVRVERKVLNPGTNKIAANSNGFEHVADLDVDPAANHQRTNNVTAAASLRLPPAANPVGNDLRIVAGGVAQSASQQTFEGLNLVNIAITNNRPAAAGGGARRALPPGRYWIRPIMRLPSSREIHGNAISATVGYVVPLNFTAAFTTALTNRYRLIHPGLAAGTRTQLVNAYISQIVRLMRQDFNVTVTNNTFAYGVNSANIRILSPANRAPVDRDYGVPVVIRGFNGTGVFGGANTLDTLNNDSDEDAFNGVGGGVFSGAYLGLGPASNWIFNTFATNAATAFGAVAGDNTGTIVAALTAGVASAPAVPAMGGVAAWNRTQRAQNAAVALSRGLADTISHELGHTLGLVANRNDIISYEGSFAPNIPNARANNFRVGNTHTHMLNAMGNFVPGRFVPGQVAHNGHTIAAGAGATAGQLPTFNQSSNAGNKRVIDVDDLNQNRSRTNLFMDSGGSAGMTMAGPGTLQDLEAELYETGNSGVNFAPGFNAAQRTEPVTTWLARNFNQMRAVLPRDQNP